MTRLSIALLAAAGMLLADTVSYQYDAAGRLTSAAYGNGTTVTYAYDKAGNLTARSVPAAQPQITSGAIGNAASFRAPLVRGELATILGTNLSLGPASAATLPLPMTLGGAQVTIGGIPAPIYSVIPTQINFQVPFEVPVSGSVPVVVQVGSASSQPQTVSLVEYSPGVFSYYRTATALDPIVVHSDYTLVTPNSPASAGEALIFYVTGVGTFDHTPPTGAGASGSPVSNSAVLPTITVGGAPVQVPFAGLAPWYVGIVQINIVLPKPLPAGSPLPLTVQFGTASAQTTNLYVH